MTTSSKEFAEKVAERLTPEEHHGSFIQVVSIIMMITNQILPLVKDCMEKEEDTSQGIGPTLASIAEEADRKVSFRGRLARVRLSGLVRRATEREERELLGGVYRITNAYIEAAKESGPQQMGQAWEEFNQGVEQ